MYFHNQKEKERKVKISNFTKRINHQENKFLKWKSNRTLEKQNKTLNIALIFDRHI